MKYAIAHVDHAANRLQYRPRAFDTRELALAAIVEDAARAADGGYRTRGGLVTVVFLDSVEPGGWPETAGFLRGQPGEPSPWETEPVDWERADEYDGRKPYQAAVYLNTNYVIAPVSELIHQIIQDHSGLQQHIESATAELCGDHEKLAAMERDFAPFLAGEEMGVKVAPPPANPYALTPQEPASAGPATAL